MHPRFAFRMVAKRRFANASVLRSPPHEGHAGSNDAAARDDDVGPAIASSRGDARLVVYAMQMAMTGMSKAKGKKGFLERD